MMPDCGVYKITNTSNGKIYIGSSNQIRRRIYLHRRDLRLGTHHSILAQRAWAKYGEQAFSFETVLLCSPINRLFYEQLVMDFYDAANPSVGMNISRVASGGGAREWTEEQKRSHSLQRIGKPLWKNDPVRYETLMQKCVKRGREHFMFGKHHSPQARAKMSATRTGRTAWNKGVPSQTRGIARTPEIAKKIRIATRSGPKAKLTLELAMLIKSRLASGELGIDLAREYRVTSTTISRVKLGKCWAE